jgi:hypothetical protein
MKTRKTIMLGVSSIIGILATLAVFGLVLAHAKGLPGQEGCRVKEVKMA